MLSHETEDLVAGLVNALVAVHNLHCGPPQQNLLLHQCSLDAVKETTSSCDQLATYRVHKFFSSLTEMVQLEQHGPMERERKGEREGWRERESTAKKKSDLHSFFIHSNRSEICFGVMFTPLVCHSKILE